MPGAECDDVVEHGLQAFGDKGLQHVALDRQAQPGQLAHTRGVASDGHADLLRSDRAAVGLDADHAAVAHVDAGHFAVLDQVDPAPVRTPRKAPGDRIVTGRACARLLEAVNREARVIDIHQRRFAADAFAVEQDGIGPCRII